MSLFLLLSSLLFGIFLLRLNLLLSTSHIRAGPVWRPRDRAAREEPGRTSREGRDAPRSAWGLRQPPRRDRAEPEHNSPRLAHPPQRAPAAPEPEAGPSLVPAHAAAAALPAASAPPARLPARAVPPLAFLPRLRPVPLACPLPSGRAGQWQRSPVT